MPEFSGTSMRLYSASPVGDLTDIDIAPVGGYSRNMFQAVPGYGYVFQIVDGTTTLHYAALRETHVGRDYLTRLGLPDAAVIPLAGGHDTYSSIAQVQRWFGGRESRRVLLVSDGFHMLRLRIIARRLGLTPYTSPAVGSPIHANVRRNTGYLFAEGFKVPFTWMFQH